jgi:hypothetical protein
VRGFAIKFYTEEGNWDLVGNNTPVFFVRDPYKFPDFIEKRHPRTNLRSPTVNTDWAIGQGVSGVPTFVIDGELFWEHDAFDMVLDHLRDLGQFADAEMRRIDHLPIGIVRTRKT